MHIIIEGPDGSGKSTLAKAIQELTGYRIQSGEGPEKYPGEVTHRAMRWLTMMADEANIIFDRHPCISHPIYSTFTEVSELDAKLAVEVYEYPAIFIYCKGQLDLDGHEKKKGYDSEGHVKTITDHHVDICRMYDQWAQKWATMIFDRSRPGDVTRIIKLFSQNKMMSDIESFHQRFGLEYTGKPRVLDLDLMEFRNRFLEEETEEWFFSGAEAIHHINNSDSPEEAFYTHKLEKQLDGLVDLVYVAFGTAYLQGFDSAKFSIAWRRVHEANMRKIRASSADESKRGSTFDVVKPPGWQAPRLTDLIEDNNFSELVKK